MSNLAKKEYKDMLLLFLIALILTGGIFFLDEGRYSLDFLVKPWGIVQLITWAFFFSVFPIGAYNFASESKYKKNAFVISMIGYIPIIFFFCLPLIVSFF